MAKGDNDRISKDSLKSVEDFIKKTEQGKKNIQDMNALFGNMATQLFGISGAAFFKEVPKTVEELKAAKKEVSDIKKDLDTAFKDVGDALSSKFEVAIEMLEEGPGKMDTSGFEEDLKKLGESMDIKNFEDLADLEKQIADKAKEGTDDFTKYSDLKKDFRDKEEKYRKDNDKFFDDILEKETDLFAHLSYRERKQKLIELSQIGFNNAVAEGNDIVRDMALYSKEVDESVAQSAIDAGGLADKLAEAEQEAGNLNKKAFSFTEGIKDMGKNFASGIIPSMLEYDQAISDAGKDFGFVNAKSMQTSANMTELGMNAARFNMSMGDAVGLMGSLGDELSTINQDYLAGAVKNFTAIEKATGISSGELSTIAGEMMRAGKSSEDVKDSMESANRTAKMFGVNTKKVLQGVARNIDKMRTMGFQGGVESLTKMVATADRLRMNVDEIFDVAKRARTIEGAMEMASELQLAGGSFAAINPMDLLSAARKGPEELQKILTTMGDDIGTWNKKEGKLDLDAVDADRLQMVADATGQSVDSISKMIQKNAEDNKKMDFMPDMQLKEVKGPDGKPLDKDMMNNMLLDAVDVNGKALEGGLLDEAGIGSLEDLTADQAQQLIEKKVNDQKTLEEQAEANQSFKDSIDAFRNAILNMFTVFEPLIKVFTWFVQLLNSAPSWLKSILAGLTAAFVLFGTSVGTLVTQGIGDFARSVASFGKSSFSFIKNITNKDTWKNLGGKVKSAFSKKEGGSIIDKFKKGGKDPISDVLNKGGKDIASDKSMTEKGGKEKKGFFTGLSEGIQSFNKVKVGDILKFAASLLIIGGAIVGFTYALASTGGEASMAQWVNAGAALVLLGGSVYLMSKIFGEVTMDNVLKGALAMVAVGASLIPFAFAAQMLTSVDWGSVLAGVGIMALVAVGLMGFGLMLFELWPLLAVGLIALVAIGASLLIASVGLMAIGAAGMIVSQVDWSAFSTMGDALMSAVPGLLAFGFAGLMFFNPILMLGMLTMIGTLSGLAAVMIPLAESLPTAADGLDRMADGLERLMAATSSLDLEKLDMLRNLSWSMAIGAVGGGMMGDSIGKIAEALAKIANIGEGGGKSGGTQKIQVDLKLNGRDLQSIIIDDTEIVS